MFEFIVVELRRFTTKSLLPSFIESLMVLLFVILVYLELRAFWHGLRAFLLAPKCNFLSKGHDLSRLRHERAFESTCLLISQGLFRAHGSAELVCHKPQRRRPHGRWLQPASSFFTFFCWPWRHYFKLRALSVLNRHLAQIWRVTSHLRLGLAARELLLGLPRHGWL